jgi:1-acyl-sn-glycerol-3-phosphate acyltransferase
MTLEVDAGVSQPAPDPFGLDLAFRRRCLPPFRFLHDRYWRVEVTGAQHIPEDGPALLVSNHSGAIPFDGAMIAASVELRRERTLRFLYDRFVENIPPVDAFYRKMGGVVATRENAVTVLNGGDLLLVFPEGVSGVAKPFGDRYRLRTFSAGFARLALALDVPIVPVAVVGAEDIYPLVGRVVGIGKALGMPYVPVTPFFPMLGLLGTLPLPTKWFIRFGKPIRLSAADGQSHPQRSQQEAGLCRRRIQGMVTRLRKSRQSVFFG